LAQYQARFLVRHSQAIVNASGLLASFSIWLLNSDFKSAPYSEWPAFIQGLVTFLQIYSWPLFSIVCVFWLGALLAGRDPSNWPLVNFLVNRARDRAYQTLDSDIRHHHRVTLFKYENRLPKQYKHWSSEPVKMYSLRWIFQLIFRRDFKRGGQYPVKSGWLVPVMRSDSSTEECYIASTFAVPKNNQDAYEGIVGRSYKAQSTVVKTNDLPLLKSSNNGRRLWNQYASKTHCSTGMIESMLTVVEGGPDKRLPRTIGAIPIVVQVGDDTVRWGVMVFDSKAAGILPDSQQLNAMFSTTIEGIQKAIGGTL